MKKLGPILAAIAGVLVLLVGGFVGIVSMQPGHIHMDKQITIAATAADMAPYAKDLKKVNEWSPWDEKDPDQTETYTDSTTGVGASYSWDGNDEVGAGSMTVAVDEPAKVVHTLAFTRPFESEASSTISWKEDGESVVVTWGFDTEANFMLKGINLMSPLADGLAPDYEKGLAMLKPLVEKAAEQRKAAEAAAAKAAEEAAAAEEGEPAPK